MVCMRFGLDWMSVKLVGCFRVLCSVECYFVFVLDKI